MRSRIALNALALRPGGSGVQTYIRELLRQLPHVVDADIRAIVQHDAASLLPPQITPQVAPVAAGVRRAYLGMRSIADADLVHGLDASLPLKVRVPSVVTVYDLSVFDAPWAYPRRRALGKQLQLRHAARTADKIIAISTFTAERLRARFGREAEVIPCAPSPEFTPPSQALVRDVRARYELPEQFVLHVGNVEARKDLDTLADACIDADLELVLAGTTRSFARAASPRARMLGYVEQRHLPALYGAATVFAYPSLYEGFGLPPLEAMACGTAVVATDATALPEVLGDAALLVPAHDRTALASGLRRLVGDEAYRAELAAAGIRRARSFSWTRTAALTADVYRSLGLSV